MRWLVGFLCAMWLSVGVAEAQSVQPWISGAATSTDTAAHTLISAASLLTNESIFVTSIECSRDDAGTTPAVLTFNDTAATTMILPNAGNGSGNNYYLLSPITAGPAIAFKFTSGTNITTVRCNAQGFVR